MHGFIPEIYYVSVIFLPVEFLVHLVIVGKTSSSKYFFNRLNIIIPQKCKLFKMFYEKKEKSKNGIDFFTDVC